MCLFVMGQVVTCAEILTCVLMLAQHSTSAKVSKDTLLSPLFGAK